ncbi:MAG: hypothetical protein N3I35_10040 [Clostridia bacterium]|nr:hypothetical protein [Clostridia bacterium]
MIHILWCTIRPQTFMQTHSDWMAKCSCTENVKTMVALNTEEHAAIIRPYGEKYSLETIIVGDERIGMAYPAYCLSSRLKADDMDVVVLASDDIFPPEAWDEYLINKFADFSGCLYVRDGYQENIKNKGLPSITIPIMTYNCLKELNHVIYHPEYRQLFCDSELYINLKEKGLLKDDRESDMTTFEHRHYLVNKRDADIYDSVFGSYWNRDAAVFKRRMCLSLEDRLKV